VLNVGLGDTFLKPKPKLKPETQPSEHLEQVRLINWFRRSYPSVRVFAVPNGGGRSMAQGASLKAEGVSPGVPDLFVPEWLLWVEMKKESGGIVSPVQKDWIAYLESIGHRVIIGRGFEDAKRQIESVKKPL
jgi:hypothetical protein